MSARHVQHRATAPRTRRRNATSSIGGWCGRSWRKRSGSTQTTTSSTGIGGVLSFRREMRTAEGRAQALREAKQRLEREQPDEAQPTDVDQSDGVPDRSQGEGSELVLRFDREIVERASGRGSPPVVRGGPQAAC
jgi:hypothetical protein